MSVFDMSNHRFSTVGLFWRSNRDATKKTPNDGVISPEAGHALEILGHAIEYLTDEFVHEGGSLRPSRSALEAIQLLMARNREIYSACPVVQSLRSASARFIRSILSEVRRDLDRGLVISAAPRAGSSIAPVMCCIALEEQPVAGW